MEGASAGVVPDYVLGLSAKFLARRDLPSCRHYALEARESNPRKSSVADQIIAIADVLLAAERRLGDRHLDYFSILQIRRIDSENPELIRSHFEKLAALLNPSVNKFAFSEEALGLVRDAWSVLSDPVSKARYESKIDNAETFWTVCPYCFCMYEYEKLYQECCLRCQSCRRAFHGVAINPPPERVMAGKEKYYYCLGQFPLGHEMGAKSVDGCPDGRDQVNLGTRNVKADVPRVTKNIKTTAKNTKKIMGRGIRNGRNVMKVLDLTVE